MDYLALCNETLGNLNEPTLKSFDDVSPSEGKWDITTIKRKINISHKVINGIIRAVVTNGSVSGTASTWEYDMPTDCQEIISIHEYDGTDYTPLTPTTMAELDKKQLDNRAGYSNWRTSYGTPTEWFYSRDTGKFGVFKGFSADTTDGMNLYYVMVLADMSATTALPFNSLTRFDSFHQLISVDATMRLLREDGNQDWTMWRDIRKEELRELQELVDYPFGGSVKI